MSDTTTDDTCSRHAVPTPEPLAGLTGAPAAIYTELVGLTEPATAAELALAAGLGRSTAGKALATLEQRGLAVRAPGGHDGPRRTPDLWRAAPAPEAGGDGTSDHGPVCTRPESSVTDSAEPVGGSADDEGVPGGETAPVAPVAPGDGNAAPATVAATVPVTEAPHDAQPQDGELGGRAHDEGGSDGSGDGNEPAAGAGAGQQSAPAEAVNLSGEKKRLAPGGLRQMVIDHLQAHPGEAFTATGISRVIEKSSGAIANVGGSSEGTDAVEVTEESVRVVLQELVAAGRAVRDGVGDDGARFRSVTVAASGKRLRRAPGQLRERVLEFLRERPGEEWGPTGLSRELDASSGAISNALDKLVALNLVRRTGDRPRRFTAIQALEAAPPQ